MTTSDNLCCIEKLCGINYVLIFILENTLEIKQNVFFI